MENKPYITWEEVKESLNLTEEQELAVQLEMGIIEAEIEARKKSQLTQRELSKKVVLNNRRLLEWKNT